MNIAIIGAGVAGLAAAFDLVSKGHNVSIYEAASYAGGLAAGFKSDRWDWHLEHFYHHWFETDQDILDLIEEIGHRDRVFFPRPVTSIYTDGQIYPFDSPQRMLLFPKLPLIPKLRFGLVGLYLRLTQNWQALEKETAHNWLRRTMGETAYNTLWKPLLIGKFGDYYQDVNMAWFWARIHKRSYKLGYFEGGFQAFVDALVEANKQRGCELFLNEAIAEVSSLPSGQLQLNTTTGNTATFDQVLVTVSPHLLAKMTPALPGDYLASLQNLKSMGAVVVVLALKHRLTEDHYWINLPKDEGTPFLALVEHTNFIDRKHYDNDHIVYCGDYLMPDHEFFSLSKDELLARFLPDLVRFNPDFDKSWVKDSWLFRTRYAQPVPPINHSQNIPDLQTPISGLYWASMSQVYPWDRGTNYAVEIGRRAARLMLENHKL
jgi:protoporphyrinogen oxidase